MNEIIDIQNNKNIDRQYELQNDLKSSLQKTLDDVRLSLMNQNHEQHNSHIQNQTQQQRYQHKSQLELIQLLNQNHADHRTELAKAVARHGEIVSKQLSQLTQVTESRLDKLSDRVNDKLSEGFEQTVKTFGDVLKRLALIDEAQKKISELSTNVVSLQNVLTDKKSRGTFGEVQLYALVANVLATEQYQKQAKLSNGKIVDCLLKLPEPTGNLAIDSKFPLENYQRMLQTDSDPKNKTHEKAFKQDIKKHIQDIASKYIIANETADSAILFLPAEAIFAEIHAYHQDVVEFAWRHKVWLTSPSTLMAILTTAKAVLKDEATKQQIHVIQAHLNQLGSDFSRFQNRFDQLSKHIEQAATDVKQIHTSASKISNRFQSIEQVQLAEK